MQNIELSIIIPVYNTEKYLERCLDSILIENENRYEVLLINDGSTDGSEKICKAYEEQNQVHYYSKPNGGLSDARNYGMQKATGKYIWFIDSDDYLAEGSVSKVLEMAKTDCDILVCLSQSADDEGITADECSYTIDPGIYSDREYMKVMQNNPDSLVFCAPYHICKRSLIEEHNLSFYKDIIHEDELWTPQILLLAKSVYYSGERLYYHYMRTGSITQSSNLVRSGECCFIVVRELLRIFDASGREDLVYPRDRMADMFLEAVWKAPDSWKKNGSFQRSMPLKNAYYPKTKTKAIVYFISPKLFLKMYSAFKKIRR